MLLCLALPSRNLTESTKCRIPTIIQTKWIKEKSDCIVSGTIGLVILSLVSVCVYDCDWAVFCANPTWFTCMWSRRVFFSIFEKLLSKWFPSHVQKSLSLRSNTRPRFLFVSQSTNVHTTLSAHAHKCAVCLFSLSLFFLPECTRYVCLFCCTFFLVLVVLLLFFISVLFIRLLLLFSHNFLLSSPRNRRFFFSTSLYLLCVCVFRCDAAALESKKGRDRENVFVVKGVCWIYRCFVSLFSTLKLCCVLCVFFWLAAEIFISNSFSVLVSACTNRSIHVQNRSVAGDIHTVSRRRCLCRRLNSRSIVITVVALSSICAVVFLCGVLSASISTHTHAHAELSIEFFFRAKSKTQDERKKNIINIESISRNRRT